MTEAESDVGELWEKLSQRLAEDFDHQLTASDGTGKAIWSGRGEALLRRAEACVEKACNDFPIEAAVAEQLQHGAMALRFFAISAIVLAAGAAVLSTMGVQPYHWLVAGLALVALGFGAGQFLDGRRKVKQVLEARAKAARIQLRADLNRELSSHVHGYYTKLGSIFDPVQELCQRQVDEVSPQITAAPPAGRGGRAAGRGAGGDAQCREGIPAQAGTVGGSRLDSVPLLSGLVNILGNCAD